MDKAGALGVVGLVLGLTACGPQAAGDWSTVPQPILGGEQVPAGEYPEVVLVETGGFMCTGTLITRRVVLTAAHCLDFAGLEPSQVGVGFGDSLSSASNLRAAEFRVHPGWNPETLVNDLALIRLDRDAPAQAQPVPPLPAALGLSQQDVGVDLLYVGFGINSSGGSGLKMWIQAPLDLVCTRASGCYYARANTICIDQAAGGTCSGDSGGPAFVERDGLRYVAGVTSYGDESCLYFGCSTKVDAFEDFITDFLGAADGTACEQDGDCASRACRDGFCCDAECAGPCTACDLPGQPGHCQPLPDGLACDDANLCNGREVCQAGLCQPGEPLQCADEVACTRDLCEPESGCVFSPSVLDCFDDNPCTEDRCDAQSGCLHPAVADGTSCDWHSTCQAGQCVAEQRDGDGCGCGGRGRGPGPWLLALAGIGWLRRLLRRRGTCPSGPP